MPKTLPGTFLPMLQADGVFLHNIYNYQQLGRSAHHFCLVFLLCGLFLRKLLEYCVRDRIFVHICRHLGNLKNTHLGPLQQLMAIQTSALQLWLQLCRCLNADVGITALTKCRCLNTPGFEQSNIRVFKQWHSYSADV